MMNRFQRIRQDHSRETAEDYVELVASLIEEKGEARAVDLADRLGISQVTVSKTIQRLKSEGLLDSEKYRSIRLTPDGKAMAERARRRHEIVLGMLIKLGVPADVAEVDAEGIEHHVSEKTLSVFEEFLREP